MRFVHTAEVTGSIPVAPTSKNTFPESASDAVCQKTCQKITGCAYENALSAVPFAACGLGDTELSIERVFPPCDPKPVNARTSRDQLRWRETGHRSDGCGELLTTPLAGYGRTRNRLASCSPWWHHAARVLERQFGATAQTRPPVECLQHRHPDLQEPALVEARAQGP
jgi:hypothetical protein